jgi:hypothetical protein
MSTVRSNNGHLEMAGQGKKRCGKCTVYKIFDEFGDNKSKKDGKQPWCKKCTNEEAKKRKKAAKADHSRVDKSDVWKLKNFQGVRDWWKKVTDLNRAGKLKAERLPSLFAAFEQRSRAFALEGKSERKREMFTAKERPSYRDWDAWREISVKVVSIGEKSFRIDTGNMFNVSIPESVCEYRPALGEEGWCKIKEWMVIEKGLLL